jgi:hypothetical protein
VTTRRAFKGALCGFLETYTSRNLDYDGWWLLGLVVADLTSLRIDLLAPTSTGVLPAPREAATRWAVVKFQEQVAKARLSLTMLREAWLDVTKGAGTSACDVNGQPRAGFDLCFRATATTDRGRTYECTRSVCVAPHREAERRSTRRLPHA